MIRAVLISRVYPERGIVSSSSNMEIIDVDSGSPVADLEPGEPDNILISRSGRVILDMVTAFPGNSRLFYTWMESPLPNMHTGEVFSSAGPSATWAIDETYFYRAGTGSGSVLFRDDLISSMPLPDGNPVQFFGMPCFSYDERTSDTPRAVALSQMDCYFTGYRDDGGDWRPATFRAPLDGGAGPGIIVADFGGNRISCSDSGEVIAVANSNIEASTAFLLHVAEPLYTLRREFNVGGHVNIEVSHTGAYVLVTSGTGLFAIYDAAAASGGPLISLDGFAFEAGSFSLDDSVFAAYSPWGSSFEIYAVPSGELIRTFPDCRFFAWVDIESPAPPPPFWTSLRSAYEVIQ